MKKRLVSILMISMFLVGIMPLIVIPTTVAMPDYEPMRFGPEFGEKELPLDMASMPEIVGPSHHSYWEIGEYAIWMFPDYWLGYWTLTYFQLRGIGTNVEIWVQANLAWPAGDPRAYPTITDEMVDYLIDEYDNTIYPTDTSYFGIPDFHDGSGAVLDDILGLPSDYYEEPGGRNVMLVSNIRDENYYDYTYPYYVAGLYSSTPEYYFERNVISIDSYAWELRIGAEGTEWVPGVYVNRPYTYEAIIAHELQHLIHSDYVPGDDSFMNEGCSMYSELLCGYGIPWGDINSYLYTPDNSLTVWGDQGGINILADYGAAALWAIYLSDQFGPTFLADYMAAGIPSIWGLNALLSSYGEDFESVYHAWRIANLIHTDDPGGGKYNYQTIDLGGPDAIPARTYDINNPWVSPTAGADFGNTITILDYDTGISMIEAHGSDYIKFNNLHDQFDPILTFDGDDLGTAPQTWILEDMDTDGDLEWYSTTGDLVDLAIFAETTLPSGTVTLTIDAYWDIEDYWDFGFVQVSTDGGETWTSLSNAYTTSLHDPAAKYSIVANLPGLTSWSGYITTDGWVTMDFDLSPYAGNTVLLAFRYMTDWGTAYPGFYVDNVKINGAIIDDADTNVIFAPLIPEIDFLVTVIGVEYEKNEMPKYKLIQDLTLDDMTETGMMYLDHFIEKKGWVLLIVSPELGPADYTFSVVQGE